jgi:hypothetical protein
MREGDERTANQEMAWGQDSAVTGIFGKGSEWTRVQDGLDIAEKSAELFRGEMSRAYHSSQMVLHALDPRLPETTVMRSCWGVEVEGGTFRGQEVIDGVFVRGGFEKGTEPG